MKIHLLKASFLKTCITAVVAVFIISDTYGQQVNVGIHPLYQRSVKKEKLNEVKTLGDILPYYPVNWITSYDSVRIIIRQNGKVVSAKGKNVELTQAQKEILGNAELFSEIEINVWYKFKEPYFKQTEKNHMHVKLTVAPETEAEYAEGKQQMMKYLKEKAVNKIDTSSKDTWKVKIKFTINEEGNINDAKLVTSSGDKKTDRLFLEAINKMPKWKPAKTSEGKKIKQEFEFTAGRGQGC
jgi:TonB family protein